MCGIVEIDNKILLVRHTYGTAKDRILLPGGYVKDDEIPTTAIEREIYEETSVVCKAKDLYSMQFKSEQWCAVLTAEYVSSDSLEVVRAELSESPLVDEVNYQRSLVDALNANLSRISLILAFFIALLLFISYVLINNTVRLNVYARRFTIHTMKLVGATRSFIRAPFLVQAAFQGIFSAFLAIIALLGILFFMRSEFEQMFEIFRLELLLMVMGIVMVSGLLICLTSTYFVVNKLVSLKKDELYY